MDFKNFLDSVANDSAPPASLSDAAKALWWTKKGDWEAAHDVAQEIPGRLGSRIHGLLHAIEGDMGNAAYWYHRAGEEPIDASQIDTEWETIAKSIL